MNNDRSGFYQFIAQQGVKGLLWLGGIVLVYFLAEALLPENWENVLAPVTRSRPLTFLIFFLSEAVIGIIPAEFFVIWAKKNHTLPTYVGFVALLSMVSYLAGMLAYGVGRAWRQMPFMKKLMQRESAAKYVSLYHRWGGAIIGIAAITPLPYGLFSLISGAFRFPFKHYLLYALFRFLRFLIIGYAIWILRV